MGFDSLFGHNSAVAALRRTLEADELAGTYVFVGRHGIGKTTLALAFGQAAACLHPCRNPFDSCGECDSCRRAIAGGQPEIAVISPASEQTQIWQFWDRDGKPPGILQHTLQYAPVVGRKRVYVVERADTLNEATANSLLKVLEEPPPYALFILLAPHPARLLPTILSRCQLVRLMTSKSADLMDYLVREHDIDSERARILAAYAEGCVGTAIGLAKDRNTELDINKILDLAESIQDSTALGALKAAESLRKVGAGFKSLGQNQDSGSDDSTDSVPTERLGRRQLGIVIDALAAYYRDLLAIRLGGPEADIVHTDRRFKLAQAAAGSSPGRWMRCLEDLLAARRRVDQNASTRLLTDWLAIRLVVD